MEDRHGAKLIVEIQRGTLDRNHTYKILDYYDEYKEKNPNAFIELMIIANKISYERRKRLESHGISWKEIPESMFQSTIKTEDKAPEAISNMPVNNNQNITKKSRRVGKWNELNFFNDMRNRCPDEILKVAIKIMEWIKERQIGPEYGNGEVFGTFFALINSKGKEYRPFTVISDGRMEIWFASIKQMNPFDNEQNLLDLLFRLNQINGVTLDKESIRRYPGIKLSVFIADKLINQFFAVFDWVIQEIKSVESK